MKSFVSHSNRNISFVLLALLCFLALISCEENNTSFEENIEGIRELVERGPARVTLEINKKEISIADRINLTISVDIEEDYEVELPAFGEKLEEFGIVDYHNMQPELTDNNRKLISRSYVLEPFLSGDYSISPMKIYFYKKEEKETDKHYIETPEVIIKVTSLLPDDMKDMKLHEIIPPLPYPRSYKMWWIGAGTLMALLLAGVSIYYRKRSIIKEAPEMRLRSHEIAYNEIKALVDENLIEKGEIKQFYLRLSAIIRRYIENRFGLKAPEQTTEEFLTGLEDAQDFPAEYKSLLNKFLRHCDLVKFARFQPDTQDTQKSFDSCKAFIQGTEEQE